VGRQREAYQLKHLSEVKRVAIADLDLPHDKYQESVGVGTQLDIDRHRLSGVLNFPEPL
jgi:hypothetical protein